MAVFNPLQFFIFPFLFFIALPLALCAGFTTILAFMVLFLRLFLVYFDVGLETVRYALLGHAAHTRYVASQSRTPSPSEGGSPPSTPEAARTRQLQQQRRRRRQSSVSSGTATPVGGRVDGLGGLTPSVGFERDFEGVGGWRLDRVDLDADADEFASDQQWYSLNSRLEIPAAAGRHHYRSQSGGAVLSGAHGLGLYMKGAAGEYSPDALRIHASPNSSRSRTPTNSRPHAFTKLDEDGYFPMLDGKHTRKLRC
ncbi:hypothetical protein GGR52DRAFT_329975 [Hypoxylon sp. FL1284]|nr:hypothetical protein GGR52DRAFT_329975 [Hypoxylon sp. FL1284]